MTKDTIGRESAMAAKKICIDAGHGGEDNGAVYCGRKEKDDTLTLAKKLQTQLQDQGIEVIMTRTVDKAVVLKDRITLANKEKCDYFISLHRDKHTNINASGAGVWIYSKSQDTEHAKKIQKTLLSCGFSDKGIKRGAENYTDYAVNKDTDMLACLAEMGFITNNNDNAIFDEKIEDIASEIAKTLCSIVGVTYKVVSSKISNKPQEITGAGITVKEWQTAAIKDGFKFPKRNIAGAWDKSCVKVAKRAICKRRAIYKFPNLTRLIQREIGIIADGKFGTNTHRAVISYQECNKLTPDGVVGLNTWKTILRIK